MTARSSARWTFLFAAAFVLAGVSVVAARSDSQPSPSLGPEIVLEKTAGASGQTVVPEDDSAAPGSGAADPPGGQPTVVVPPPAAPGRIPPGDADDSGDDSADDMDDEGDDDVDSD